MIQTFHYETQKNILIHVEFIKWSYPLCTKDNFENKVRYSEKATK